MSYLELAAQESAKDGGFRVEDNAVDLELLATAGEGEVGV